MPLYIQRPVECHFRQIIQKSVTQIYIIGIIFIVFGVGDNYDTDVLIDSVLSAGPFDAGNPFFIEADLNRDGSLDGTDVSAHIEGVIRQ